jgi:hypothetical protein
MPETTGVERFTKKPTITANQVEYLIGIMKNSNKAKSSDKNV